MAMNPLTRKALEYLQKHGSANLWSKGTVEKRQGRDTVLWINHTTAATLVRLGYAEPHEDDQGRFVNLTDEGEAVQL